MINSWSYKYLIMLLGLLFSQVCNAQNSYFQQDVNYKIDVTLIDSIHLLKGTIDVAYTNNSPNTLKEIYIHLWGNAFKNKSTAFSKQQLRVHNTDFYFADEEDYGYYDELDFRIDNKEVNWELDKTHVDIARIDYSQGLESGQSITISTPFELKVPASFSRLGHVESSYQFTQWYPKPAVYDQDGWHTMPNLNMGEYYSEFGDFDVKITLPANYYVAATGELQTNSEKQFIQDRIEYTKNYLEDSIRGNTNFPPSSPEMKTISYTAKDVHDFAWFADKRFLVQRTTAVLDSGKKIECNSFFTDEEISLWEKSAFYISRAVKFYSERVGEYPYPQATAVQSALSAGAGMEYPMITVIGISGNGPALDQVITHEVGHNWFYGILGSNERDHAWMDEGLNSYHDHKYTEIYYEDFNSLGGIMPKKITKQLEYPSLSYVYHLWARMGKDQAPNTTSDDLTSVNYFIGAYEKPAMAFALLEKYLGEEALVGAMKAYYDEWKFKHPQPEDVKVSFENSTEKDLEWLFDGLMYSNKTYDYKITHIDKNTNKITIKNNGQIAAPFQLTYEDENEVSSGKWQEGFMGEKQFDIEYPELKFVILDKEKISFDLNPKNDDYKIKGGPIASKPALRLLSGLRTSTKSKIFAIPTLGGNRNDGVELGLAFHNYGIPISTFQYYIQPALGTRSGELVGSFELRKDLPQKQNKLRNISIALGGKSFHDFYNEEFDYNLRFTRIVPSIEFEWQKKLVSPVKHFLRYRPIILVNDRALFDREIGFEGLEQDFSVIHELGYEYAKSSPIVPLNVDVRAEYRAYENFNDNEQYLKLYADLDAKFAYKAKKFFNIRLFGGFFPIHSERGNSTSSTPGNFSLFHRGVNDYRYDDNFLDRRGQSGFLSRQVTWNDGGFKNGVSNAFPLGLSNNYMLSTNISIDLPFSWTTLIPIKPYLDAGLYSFKPTTQDPFNTEILYSGGIMLDFQHVVGIYLPLFYSEQIAATYGENEGVLNRISFSIDINKLNPHRLKRWLTR